MREEIHYKSLDELIEALERLKRDGAGIFSIPQALLRISLEIKELKEKKSFFEKFWG
jgi:hypothetical protein